MSAEPVRLGKVIWELVSRGGYGSPSRVSALRQTWAQVVDPQIASLTHPVRLSRGVLEVVVASSALLQELSFREQELVERLRMLWPEANVTRVRFRLGKVPRWA